MLVSELQPKDIWYCVSCGRILNRRTTTINSVTHSFKANCKKCGKTFEWKEQVEPVIEADRITATTVYPQDVMVIELPQGLAEASVARESIVSHVYKVMPDMKVIILSGGMKVSFIHKEDE